MISTPRSRAKVNNGFININPSTTTNIISIIKSLTLDLRCVVVLPFFFEDFPRWRLAEREVKKEKKQKKETSL